jgi:hypothetical protein
MPQLDNQQFKEAWCQGFAYMMIGIRKPGQACRLSIRLVLLRDEFPSIAAEVHTLQMDALNAAVQ